MRFPPIRAKDFPPEINNIRRASVRAEISSRAVGGDHHVGGC